MCGIMGYSGSLAAAQPILEGLARLEYRGYDSAGICLQQDTHLITYKKEGKLSNLKQLLEDQDTSGHLGIGHTRWATHGEVNDINAHPHNNQIFSIVHNGIIENADELRKELDYNFLSETDSEVFLALVTQKYKECGDIAKAIVASFSKLEEVIG